ncbi:MAG TPA: 6,7-dimethyl-8-ribityllumazine synthase [Actinomycetota bacterium]|nr:6,7-dimethyl-8-ribityllumazine synthase [Actinomycetota bacterium]
MTVHEGEISGRGRRIATVVSRFNDVVTSRLLEGALTALRRHGVADDDVVVAWTPGAFEIPLAAKALAASGEFDAVICLGAVVRGETAHFDYVAGEAASGVQRVALETGVPCIFGVLTTDTLEQALDRAGGKHGNKGWEAASSALEMAGLLDALPKREA